jgi:antitoxin component YwqK of YwqJK toxin-antitoxin module
MCYYDTLGKLTLTEEYLDDIKDGYIKQFHKNGKIKSVVFFVKGKQEGKSYEFNSDSMVVGISIYKSGILQGYEKINQKDESNKKQGIWKEFYENFDVKKEMKFNDDSLDGYVKEYDKTGNLLSTKKFNNGKIILNSPEIANVEIYRDVFEDGTLKYEGVYLDGVAIGTHYRYKKKWKCDSSIFLRDDTSKVYIKRLVCRNEPIPDSAIDYFDGIIVAKGACDSMRNRIGLWYEYHNNGDFKAKGIYKEGNRIGDWEYYYSEGKLEQKGKYDKKGKAQGIWKWYYESGKLLREENYVNGKREGLLTEYNEDGKTVIKVNYLDNKKEGPWVFETHDYYEMGNYVNDEQDSVWVSYYMPGKIKRYEGKFVNGEPVGIHKMYQPNGKKLYIGNYVSGMKDGDWRFFDDQDYNYLTITYKNDIEIKWQGEKIRPTYEEGLRTYQIVLDKNHSKTIRK